MMWNDRMHSTRNSAPHCSLPPFLFSWLLLFSVVSALGAANLWMEGVESRVAYLQVKQVDCVSRPCPKLTGPPQ
jgi:hypothetical protein